MERVFPRPINCSSLIAVFSRRVSSRQTRRQDHTLASENLNAPGNFIAVLFPTVREKQLFQYPPRKLREFRSSQLEV